MLPTVYWEPLSRDLASTDLVQGVSGLSAALENIGVIPASAEAAVCCNYRGTGEPATLAASSFS